MTGLRARLLGAVLLAAMLVSGSAFARVEYLCRMSGLVGSRCCCERHDDTAEPGVSTLRQTDCCQPILQKSGDRALAEPPPVVRAPPPAIVALVECALPPAPLVALERRTAVRSRGPPAQGPPLYIKHCSLLG